INDDWNMIRFRIMFQPSEADVHFAAEGARLVEEAADTRGRAERLVEKMLFVEEIARPQGKAHLRVAIAEADIGDREAAVDDERLLPLGLIDVRRAVRAGID